MTELEMAALSCSVLKTDLSRTKSSPRGRLKTLLTILVASVIAIVALILVGLDLGWIGRPPAPPQVYVRDFEAAVGGVSECTAVLSYVLHNNGTIKAFVDIDYYDNGVLVAHDLRVVGPGEDKYVTYYIEYVNCVAQHHYEARIMAVSAG